MNQILFDMAVNLLMLSGGAAILFLIMAEIRVTSRGVRHNILFGITFGILSAIVVNQPIYTPFGATFDTRAAPVVLAAIFGGPLAGFIAATCGAVARFNIGGPVAWGGVVGFYLYWLAGMAIAVRYPWSQTRPYGIRGMGLIAVISTIAVLPSFFVSVDFLSGLQILNFFGWVLLLSNLIGISFLGCVLERSFLISSERERHRIQNNLSRMARDAGDVGIWQYRFEADEFEWDTIQCRMFQISRSPVSGADFTRLIHEADRDIWCSRFHESAKSQLRLDTQIRVHLPDQQIRYIRFLAEFSVDKETGSQVAIGIAIDNTEGTLKNQEIRLKSAALDSASNGILISRAEGDQEIVYANAGFTRITGYQHDEIIGRNCRFLNEVDREQSGLDDIRRSMKARSDSSGILLNFRKDGTPFWNYLQIAPIKDCTGNVTHFIGIQEDVTKDIEVHQSVQEMRDRLNAILTAAPDAILTVDSSLRISLMNDAAEQLFGWTREELTQFPLHVLIPEITESANLDWLTFYCSDRDALPGYILGDTTNPIRSRRKDGSTFPASITLSRFEVKGVASLALIARDMSDIVAANRQLSDLSYALSKQLSAAQSADEAKSGFLLHVSHELRTPLNAIIGFSDFILFSGVKELGEERVKDYALDINNSGKHLLELINDVLDISKLDVNVVILELAPIDAKEAVLRAIHTIEPTCQDKRLVITNSADNDVNAIADPRALYQCLLNLLSNAVKYSPIEGRINIQTTRLNGQVCISIRDEGPGMSPGLQSQIGTPFLRAKDPMTSSIEGTGLGLAITTRLMSQMDGELRFESEDGEGCNAMLILKAYPAFDAVPVLPAIQEFKPGHS